MYDFLIVGAGLFGATIANILGRKGKRCIVVERRQHIAGNIYTEKCVGIHVHKYGAHIFHTDDEVVWRYVNEFSRFCPFINSPIARYGDELYSLPFNMHTFYAMWGVKTPIEAKRKIAEEREISRITIPHNLEEQGVFLVGNDLYTKLIKGYTEKQWGKSARELPASILMRVPLRYTYNNNYFNDYYQGIPENGYTDMIQRMLDGTEVFLNTDYLENREELSCVAKMVIYTGPIDAYYKYCYGPLAYRSLRFEETLLDVEDYQGNAVVNYTDAETPFTRIIEHKHFGGCKTPHTVITREYPQTWIIGAEPYYPIADVDNSCLYNRYKLLAEAEPNVIFGGRLGTYQYLDMDDVVHNALCLGQSL